MPRKSRRGMSTSITAVCCLSAALALSACTASRETTTVPTLSPSTAGQSVTLNSSSAPLESTAAANEAPVYWIGRAGDDAFLYREFRTVDNAANAENPITDALRIMMSEKPLDPDYFTSWQSPQKLATSISGKNIITVDLSPDAFSANMDAGMAQRAVQQLVYTATAAASSSGMIDAGQQIQVVVLVDGHTDYNAFGHVKLGQPMQRDASLVAPIWVIDPQEGTKFPTGKVSFNGLASTLGEAVTWQILRKNASGNNTVVLNGESKVSTEAGKAGLFSSSADLPAGEYELRATIKPATGAPATSAVVDTKHFSVK
ncbi:GerMN domain-containing protein [Pseudarthrobacter sp. J1738]|uniref:GerMN domain-containing protein n=1 Tax=unclassified Pseudarthrobacter TaxID=2647000 RepID=UPI003D2E4FA5